MDSVTTNNRLSATGFYAEFPGFDPFPDPSSLVSPFTLKRADRNATVAACRYAHLSAPTRSTRYAAGLFFLDNSRQLDDPFLDLTNDGIGVSNPATFYDSSNATTRLGHYIGRPGGTMERFSFGGPNDSFNKRKQRTWTIGDTLTWTATAHALRIGGELRRNEFDTNLPEEQATEFEKFDNFTQLLRGVATEADTQFGITDKQFRFNDFNMFLSDDWHISRSLTLNLGVRYEFFGLPEEVNGRIGNVDFEALTNTENPVNAFIVPKNVQNTGFAAIDRAISASTRADNNHTLKGQDWNNVAPRVGFAWTPGDSDKVVVRGGYGVFYRSPLRGVHQHRVQQLSIPPRTGSHVSERRGAAERRAWSQQDPTFPFNQYLPNRIVRTAGATGSTRSGTART